MKKSHSVSFTGCTLADIVPAVDRCQKSQPKHCLCEPHIRKALELLNAFLAYTKDVGVTVIPNSIPPYFKYPIPCVSLMLTPKGGLVHWIDSPKQWPQVPFHVYTVSLWPVPAGVPKDVCGARRDGDSGRWLL